ncbi:hypothetical protein GCM10010376_86910 [Streptomyces violaceusniger]
MIPSPHQMQGGAPQLGALPGQVGPFGPYGAEARDSGDMEIEVLVVPDCPHHQQPAEERLRQALDEDWYLAPRWASRPRSARSDDSQVAPARIDGWPR